MARRAFSDRSPRADVGQRKGERVANLKRQELTTAYVFILPAVLLLIAIIAYPLAKSIYLSFLNSSFINRNPRFVGLQNYIKAFRSLLFWKIAFNSVVWTGLVVGFQFLVGFVIALFLNRILVARGAVRSLLLIPWVIPGVIVGVIWKLMYNPQIGLINQILLHLRIIRQNVAFLADEHTALLSVIVVAIWKGSPFSMVMYLAGLQSVRQDLVEASLIDGANFFQRLRNVVMPEIASVIRVTLMLTTIWTFNYFDITYAMTNGGPNKATQIFPLEIYEQAFRQFQFSYSSSIAVLSLVIIGCVSALYIRELHRRKAI